MSPVIAVMVQTLSKQLGMFGLIVDATHQSIFDAHAAFRSQIVVVCGVKHLRGVETFVHWNKLISQFIARGVQRHSQTHRNTLSRKFFNTRHHADRGDGNVTCRNTEALRRHGTDLTNSAQYRLVVAHGLSHAHEYNVA